MVDNSRTRNVALIVATTIYGLFYLLFIIDSFGSGQLISSDVNFNPWDLEGIFVKLHFVVFLVGYFYCWKNGKTAGLVFLSWFVLLICMTIWVSTTLHKDGGCAVIMAVPLLVIGILFIVLPKQAER